jgi:hypothetical protein
LGIGTTNGAGDRYGRSAVMEFPLMISRPCGWRISLSSSRLEVGILGYRNCCKSRISFLISNLIHLGWCHCNFSFHLPPRDLSPYSTPTQDRSPQERNRQRESQVCHGYGSYTTRPFHPFDCSAV